MQVDDGTVTVAKTITVTVTDANDAPVITSSTFSAAENQTAAGTVLATDADVPADTLSWSLTGGGADSGAFTLSPTGVLSFNTAPNFETPGDANADNVYEVEVQVDDGTVTVSKTITVTVTDANDAPVITSSTFNAAENQTSIGTVLATDADVPADTLNWSLTGGGADSGAFTLSPTGVLSFNTAPNFESPGDSNGDNVYEVEVQVDDGTTTVTKAITVTVTDANDAPVITSNGGGSIAALNVNENSTTVTTVTASDVDLPADTLTYSITGGADQALFSIDPGGELSFITAPDFEAPADAGADNTYEVTVEVSDGADDDTQTITVTVDDIVSETGPQIDNATTSVPEDAANSTLVYNVNDANTGNDTDTDAEPLTYSITGGNADGVFAIDPATGAVWVANNATLDFEATPQYILTIEATDGINVDAADLTIDVTGVNEAPVLGAIGDQSVDEGATLSFTATATDADLPADTLTFSLDAASIASGMAIDANTGVFSWTPTEGQGGLAPAVTITVTDDGAGTLFDSETFTITVTDTNTAPLLGAIGDQSVDEGMTLSFTAIGTDSDDPADGLTFSLDPASIALGMTIDADTGAFSWTPTEGQGGLTPAVTITVTDDGAGTLFDSETFTITVDEVNTPPVIVSDGAGSLATIGLSENSAVATNVNAVDADMPIDTITYSIVGGADATRFVIDGATGRLEFISSPDFESPSDADSNNTYEVTVQASDGIATDTQNITIAITDVNEHRPLVDPGQAFTIAENAANGSSVGMVTGSDADSADTLGDWEIASGNENGIFLIDPTNGEIRVASNSELSYESKDSFVLGIRVSDGIETSNIETVTINVADVNEAPSGLLLSNTKIMDGTDTTGGNLLAALVAVDDDPFDTASFSVIGGPDAHYFAIVGEQLWIDAGLIDSADQKVFDLVLRTTDSGGLSFDLAVKIVIESLEIPDPVETGTTDNNPQVPLPTPIVTEAELTTPPPDEQVSGDDLDDEGEDQASADGAAEEDALGPVNAGYVSEGEEPITTPDSDGHAGNAPVGGLQAIRELLTSVFLGDRDQPGASALLQITAKLSDELFETEVLPKIESAFDKLRDDVRAQHVIDTTTASSVVLASGGLSVGYVVWLIRGGILASAAISSLPAWSFLDPIPVLARANDDEEEEGDSLDSIIQRNQQAADRKGYEPGNEDP